jgi:ribose/xylose/arabinose/galactoside ABC-type transport system permease subunit
VSGVRWYGNSSRLLLLAFLVIAIDWILLDRTRFGRYIFSVGGNVEAARLAGVRTNRVVVAAFVLAGAGAGLA